MAESEVSIQSLTPSASVIRTLKPANAKGGISMKPASWLASSLAEPPKDLTKKQAKALAKKREALIAEREREQEERATCMKLAGSLRESVSVGDSDAVVQFLTSKEHRQRSATIVGLPDAMGVDALMMAARAGHHDCVEALLKLGASTSAVDDVGRTALMHAAANGQVDSVTTLIAHGAPLDTRDATAGRTAFQHALTAGYISHESEEGGRRRRLSQTPVNGEQEGELTNAHIECMMQLSHAVVSSADPFDPMCVPDPFTCLLGADAQGATSKRLAELAKAQEAARETEATARMAAKEAKRAGPQPPARGGASPLPARGGASMLPARAAQPPGGRSASTPAVRRGTSQQQPPPQAQAQTNEQAWGAPPRQAGAAPSVVDRALRLVKKLEGEREAFLEVYEERQREEKAQAALKAAQAAEAAEAAKRKRSAMLKTKSLFQRAKANELRLARLSEEGHESTSKQAEGDAGAATDGAAPAPALSSSASKATPAASKWAAVRQSRATSAAAAAAAAAAVAAEQSMRKKSSNEGSFVRHFSSRWAAQLARLVEQAPPMGESSTTMVGSLRRMASSFRRTSQRDNKPLVSEVTSADQLVPTEQGEEETEHYRVEATPEMSSPSVFVMAGLPREGSKPLATRERDAADAVKPESMLSA